MNKYDNELLDIDLSAIKHSKLGIIATTIAIIVIIFISYAVVKVTFEFWEVDEIPDSEALILVLKIILGVIASFVGMILGLVGMFRRNTKRLFSVLGFTLNLFIELGIVYFFFFSSF